MYEVELKLPADNDVVRRRLDDVGATHLASVVQRDTYYDAPHREFAETDEALRIREQRDDDSAESRLTYKGPLVDEASKTRREHETGVDDGETATNILESLGFEAVATVEKHREFYRYDGYTVTVDDVTDVGEFVEVETESENVDEARAGAVDVLAELGFDADDQIRTSYLELLLTENSR